MLLLRNPADRGYPVEYLLSRIKGRRAALIRNWKQLLFDQGLFLPTVAARPAGLGRSLNPDRIWADLMQEYGWVYGQMNGELRELFAPYFLYAELRTLFICLRRLRNKDEESLDEMLNKSLLCDEIKAVLVKSSDPVEAVEGVERLFRSISKKFAGLAEAAKSDGLRGAEQRLTETYLTVMEGSRLHPLVHRFFERLIDARNIMSLYKYLRLDLAGLPPVLPGGSIAAEKLREIARKDDIVAIGAVIRDLTGIKVDRPEPTMVELALYKGMTHWLRQEGRDPFGPAPILDYLWRCSIEAMNLSVLYRGKDLERELISAELVM